MTFPQYPVKHRQPALFTASEFHRYENERLGAARPPAPRNVVLVFGRRWRRYLGRVFPGRFDRRAGLYHVADGIGLAVLSGVGAPHVAIVVEEWAALGTRRFLIVGMAGSLQPDLRVGDLVLCTRALRDEGTSHHYVGRGQFARPSSALTGALRSTLLREGVRFRAGPTWTTDAPYRETRAEVRRYRRRGILSVEMEAAAVFTVARCRRCDAAAIFVISDHLDEGGWDPRFSESQSQLRQALTFGIRALARDG